MGQPRTVLMTKRLAHNQRNHASMLTWLLPAGVDIDNNGTGYHQMCYASRRRDLSHEANTGFPGTLSMRRLAA